MKTGKKYNGNLYKLMMCVVVMCTAVMFMSGCAVNNPFAAKPQERTEQPVGPKTKKTTAVYHDFEDVLVPLELSIDTDRTVIVSTPGFTSGILALKGRVDRRSLFNFFNSNMQKDNWSVISQIKSPGTMIMVFQKASRTSVITIRDEQIFTYVEVGVAPTVNEVEPAGLTETPLME